MNFSVSMTFHAVLWESRGELPAIGPDRKIKDEIQTKLCAIKVQEHRFNHCPLVFGRKASRSWPRTRTPFDASKLSQELIELGIMGMLGCSCACTGFHHGCYSCFLAFLKLSRKQGSQSPACSLSRTAVEDFYLFNSFI